MAVYVGHELRVERLVKHYGRVRANDGIDATFRSSEVHALLGENGAGKSTLIKVVAGVVRADAGAVWFDDTELRGDATDERRRAIGVVHQLPTLIPRLSILENVVITEGEGWGRPRAQLGADLLDSCRRVGVTFSLDTPVELLSLGQRQRLEIARALMRDATFLVLDEPTSVLTPRERVAFFELIGSLKISGVGIVLVTHHVAEALEHSDKVTILRHGRVIGEAGASSSSLSRREVVTAMVGQDVVSGRSIKGWRKAAGGESVLRMDRISGQPPGGSVLSDVSLEVRAGEVVGVAGVEGNGQRELASAASGAWIPHAGTVTVHGQPLAKLPAKHRTTLIGDVPEDHELALVDTLSVWENLGLSRMAWLFAPLPGRTRRIRRDASEIIDKYGIIASGVDAPVAQLSGGNRQRVVLARELEKDPVLLVLCFATRGLDVLAASHVQAWVRSAADKGSAVLYISSELDELFTISDRIAVMARGTVRGILDRSAATVEKIGALMLSASNDPSLTSL